MGEAREILDRLTTAVQAADWDAAGRCYAEDAVLVSADLGELRGRDAIVSFFSVWNDAFPDSGFELLGDYEDVGAAIHLGYVTGTQTGELSTPSGQTLAPTGQTVRVRSCDIAQVDGGVIVAHHYFLDQEDLYRQLGLTGTD
jgi:ketosteroid isomerase-like protein